MLNFLGKRKPQPQEEEKAAPSVTIRSIFKQYLSEEKTNELLLKKDELKSWHAPSPSIPMSLLRAIADTPPKRC